MAASASTASAAHQADAGIPDRLMPAFGSMAGTRSAASLVPASTPAAAAAPPNSIVSASDGRASCHRVAPRAVSSATSSSRWLASSRAASPSATAASSASCSALMASSDLATTRLVASPLSSCGRPLLTCAPYRALLPCRDVTAWLILPARPDRSPSRIPAAPGRTIQETPPTARRPGPKAAGLATAGP